jgi:dipeptidyl aminopeptidase/acylaminoacyl peptidase
MKRLLILIGVQVVCLLMAAHVWAGYRVTKVIEVGPAISFFAGGALKWSPDGTKLAYFANGYLFVSDTLGISQQVASIPQPMYPRGAEWVSDSELAVDLRAFQQPDSSLCQLTVYDIETGHSRVVEQFWRTRWTMMPGHTSYSGPFLTNEGRAYYTRMVVTGLEEGDQEEIRRSCVFTRTRVPLVPSGVLAKAAMPDIESSKIQVWGDDGLYLVDWSGSDSTLLSKQEHSSVAEIRTAVSSDGSLVFNHGMLLRTNPPDTIDIREYAGPLPPKTLSCGFLDVSFNPRTQELLFEHYCEGEEPYEVSRVATFDVPTRTFALLDTLTGLDSCVFPVYASNGRMIAVLSHFKAYIIWREETL